MKKKTAGASEQEDQTPHNRGQHAPNEGWIVRLVGSQLLEEKEESQLESRLFLTKGTMAKILEHEESLVVNSSDQENQPP
jgi:hypothetical protein